MAKLDLKSKTKRILSSTINNQSTTEDYTDNEINMNIIEKKQYVSTERKNADLEQDNVYFNLPTSIERHVEKLPNTSIITYSLSYNSKL